MRQLTIEDDEIRRLIAECKATLALPPKSPSIIRWEAYQRRCSAQPE